MTEFAKSKLRPTAARRRKPTMKEAHAQCDSRCQELTNLPESVLFVLMHITLVPVDLHKLVVVNDMWFDEKSADRVMARYRHRANAQVYEHVLACRIIDRWNMLRNRERWGTGACYYTDDMNPHPPADPSLVARPTGALHAIAPNELRVA